MGDVQPLIYYICSVVIVSPVTEYNYFDHKVPGDIQIPSGIYAVNV